MTDMEGTDTERDPLLQRLFTDAEQDLAGEGFTSRIFARIEKERRRAAVFWSCAGLVAAVLLWPVGILVYDFIHALTPWLTMPVFDMSSGLTGRVLAPLNCVGSLAVLALIGLRRAFHLMFATTGTD